jgi:hypothetical protein
MLSLGRSLCRCAARRTAAAAASDARCWIIAAAQRRSVWIHSHAETATAALRRSGGRRMKGTAGGDSSGCPRDRPRLQRTWSVGDDDGVGDAASIASSCSSRFMRQWDDVLLGMQEVGHVNRWCDRYHVERMRRSEEAIVTSEAAGNSSISSTMQHTCLTPAPLITRTLVLSAVEHRGGPTSSAESCKQTL